MIDMWSCFGVAEALENRSAGREEIDRKQRRNAPTTHVVSLIERDDKHVVRQLKQPRAENCSEFLLQVLYCNLEKRDCQAHFTIKSTLKI